MATNEEVLVKIDDGLYTSEGGVWTVSRETRTDGTGWYISGINWFRVDCGPHKSIRAVTQAIAAYDCYVERGTRVVVRKALGDNQNTCPFCGSPMVNNHSTIEGVCWSRRKCTGRRQGCLHETSAQLKSAPNMPIARQFGVNGKFVEHNNEFYNEWM